MLDEARDLGFEITGQVVILEQDEVLERPVQALDCLRIARRAANVSDAAVLEPFGEIVRDVTRPIVAEQSWFVRQLDLPSQKLPTPVRACRSHRP